MNDNFLESLNQNYKNFSPQDILEKSIKFSFRKKMVYICSFGAESAIILHMISKIDNNFPIVLLNTNFLFEETIDYKNYLIKSFNLTNCDEYFPDDKDLDALDKHGKLWKINPDLCCNIRKVLPLQKVLKRYKAWISGRKSYHEGERKSLKFFEKLNNKIVVNPLANIDQNFVNSYFEKNKIKRHPLFEHGYLSIGCINCTVKTLSSDDPRSGRWYNKIKTECGIHYNIKK